MKKTFLLFCFFLLFSSVWAAQSISNYIVKSPVFLDQEVNVTGKYNNPDGNSQVLCKFLILDSNGIAIIRLTDEYTFSDATFFQKQKITDNFFKVDTNYTFSTTCGTENAKTFFIVSNREPITDLTLNWWQYFFNQDNFITFLIIIILAFCIFLFYGLWKRGFNFFGG